MAIRLHDQIIANRNNLQLAMDDSLGKIHRHRLSRHVDGFLAA